VSALSPSLESEKQWEWLEEVLAKSSRNKETVSKYIMAYLNLHYLLSFYFVLYSFYTTFPCVIWNSFSFFLPRSFIARVNWFCHLIFGACVWIIVFEQSFVHFFHSPLSRSRIFFYFIPLDLFPSILTKSQIFA
jgi:hypothetical protein